MKYYDRLLIPFTKDKGYEWEVHVEESERILWTENGLVPPMPGSEGEKLWAKVNKAVHYAKL